MASSSRSDFVPQLCTLSILALLILPTAFFAPVFRGLDYSWQLSLHMALEQGLRFGQGYLFTYGPLGILSTRLPLGSIKPVLIAGDISIYCAILYAAFLCLKRTRSPVSKILLIVSCFTLSGNIYFHNLSITLMLIHLVFIAQYKERPSAHLGILHFCIALGTFFIKLNTGIVLLCVSYAVFILFPARASLKSRVAVPLLATLLLFLTCYALNVDLPGYSRAGIELIRGHNAAMAFADSCCFSLWKLALPIVCIFTTLALTAGLQGQRFLALCALLYLFLLFKQGFVRADPHVFVFFIFAPALSGILASFARPPRGRHFAPGVIIILLLSIAALFPKRLVLPTRSVKQFFQVYVTQINRPIQKPATVGSISLADVDATTADVIPWQIEDIYSSAYQWNPRPVVQSYLAYTNWLAQQNASHYQSDQRPDLVLYSHGCIDNRYCFWDEAPLRRVMREQYRVQYVDQTYLYLRPRKESVLESLVETSSGVAELGEWIRVPETTALAYGQFKIRNSFWGILRSIFFQAPELRVEFLLKNGKKKRFRVVPDLLKSPVLVNKLVRTQTQAERYFRGEDKLLPAIDRLRLLSSNSQAFDNKIEFRFLVSVPGSPDATEPQI